MNVDLPLAEHPLPLMFPLFRPPSEATGNHVVGVSVRGEVTFRFGSDASELLQRLGVATYKLSHDYRMVPFAQLLGKIAWGFAAAEGLLPFLEPQRHILPAIVEDPDQIGRWVGSVDDQVSIGPRPPTESESLHEVMLFERRGYLLCRLQLFSSHRAPYYWVIVGKLRPGHPSIVDPAPVSSVPEGASLVEVLRALQPHSTVASSTGIAPSMSVSRRTVNLAK